MSRPYALRAYYFTCFLMMGAYVPFFPGWLRANGFRGLQMSLIMALTYLMAVLAPPAIGLLSDALGLRGSLLRWACGGTTVCFAVLSVAVLTGPMPSFAFLLAVTFGAAFFRPSMNMLADVVALEQGHNYGRVRLWGSLGFVASASVLGHVIDATAPAPLIVVVTGTLVVALLCSFLLPAPSAPPKAPVWREAAALLERPFFRRFLLASFLAQFAHIAYDLCLSLQLRDLGATDGMIGFFWALGATAEIVLMAKAARVFNAGPAVKWYWLSIGIGAARWLILAVVDDVAVLVPLQVLHAITFGLRWISALEIVRSSAGPNTLATTQGAFLAANSLGAVLGLLLWGPLFEDVGGHGVFLGASAVGALATVVAYRAVRHVPVVSSGVASGVQV